LGVLIGMKRKRKANPLKKASKAITGLSRGLMSSKGKGKRSRMVSLFTIKPIKGKHNF